MNRKLREKMLRRKEEMIRERNLKEIYRIVGQFKGVIENGQTSVPQRREI